MVVEEGHKTALSLRQEGRGRPPASQELTAAWTQVSAQLEEALGTSLAELFNDAPTSLTHHGPGKLRLEVALAELWWSKVKQSATVKRLAQLLSGALGVSYQLEVTCVKPHAPVETDSIYQEQIVKLAQQELNARPTRK